MYRLTIRVLCAVVLVGGVSHPALADLRLAIVSDPHCWPRQTVYYQNFEDIIANVNQAQVDYVLMPGDLTQNGALDQYELFRTQVAEFSAPVLTVAGNHDVGAKISPVGSSGLSDERLDRYESEIGPLFYSEAIAPSVRVVGATSSLMGSEFTRESTQWTFLEENLAPASPEEIVILLMHYPAFLDDVDEEALYSNLDPGPRAQLLQLLDENDTEYMITGHLHRPLLNVWNDVTFLSAPAVSFGVPDSVPEGWTLFTLHDDGSYTEEIQYFPLQPFPDADFDDDGDVDGNDFLVWQRGAGNSGSGETGDANGDGMVDGADLEMWEEMHMTTADLAVASNIVPEPFSCTVVLSFLAGCLIVSPRSISLRRHELLSR